MQPTFTNLFHCSTVSFLRVPYLPNCCFPYAIPDSGSYRIGHPHVHPTFPLLNHSKHIALNI